MRRQRGRNSDAERSWNDFIPAFPLYMSYTFILCTTLHKCCTIILSMPLWGVIHVLWLNVSTRALFKISQQMRHRFWWLLFCTPLIHIHKLWLERAKKLFALAKTIICCCTVCCMNFRCISIFSTCPVSRLVTLSDFHCVIVSEPDSNKNLLNNTFLNCLIP